MKKKLLIGAVAIVVAVIALRVGAGVYTSSRFNAYEATWKGEVALEQQRAAAVRRPAVHGLAPLDENAGPRYMALLAKKTELDFATISTALASGTRPPEIEPILAAEQGDLAALREAVRCTRCDWQIPWETALTAPSPNFVLTRCLCNLLVIEGRSLSAREAADRDLEVYRVGGDLCELPGVVNAMIGAAIQMGGLEALGHAIARATPGELDLDAIGKDLERLASDRLDLASILHGERLGVRSYLNAAGNGVAPPPPDLLGGYVILEMGVVQLDALLREMEAAASLDPAARDKAIEATTQKAIDSWNPIVRMSVPSVLTAAEHLTTLASVRRLVAALLLLEKARSPDGTYPARIDAPVDPASGLVAKYETTDDRKGYTLGIKKVTFTRK